MPVVRETDIRTASYFCDKSYIHHFLSWHDCAIAQFGKRDLSAAQHLVDVIQLFDADNKSIDDARFDLKTETRGRRLGIGAANEVALADDFHADHALTFAAHLRKLFAQGFDIRIGVRGA